MLILRDAPRPGVHSYEFEVEDSYVQYRYAGHMPWQYLSSLCVVLTRAVRGTRVVFYSQGVQLRDDALAQRPSAWCTAEAADHDSHDLVIPTSEGTILLPTTRDGVENAATLHWPQSAGWCRLVRDCDFRDRLISQRVTGDGMLEQCNQEWVVEIQPAYDFWSITEGPRYHRLNGLLSFFIEETNRDYS